MKQLIEKWQILANRAGDQEKNFEDEFLKLNQDLITDDRSTDLVNALKLFVQLEEPDYFTLANSLLQEYQIRQILEGDDKNLRWFISHGFRTIDQI